MTEKGIFDLTGRTALITGASRGLGRAFAKAMAQFGADVACVGRDQAKLDETIDQLGQYGVKTASMIADMSSEEDIKKMVDDTVNTFGKVDILFNNAGTATPFVPIDEITAENWDHVINVNLRGVFLTMKYVLKEMKKQKSGSIINISSVAGLRAEVPAVGVASYGASKAAVINLTQVGAMEYVKYNVKINCIAPGMHRSDIGKAGLSAEQVAEVEKMVDDYCAAEVPMGRLAEAEELTGIAVLLASDASSFITGQVFCQDGGQSARM